MENTAGWNSWIEISESAYRHNLRFFRGLIGPQPELSVVVKANAYGHGWQPIATLAARHGADSFCVHSLDEALQLRRAGFRQDILIMGHIPLRRLEEALQADCRLLLTSREMLNALGELTAGRTAVRGARVHLKLETGTQRQGVEGADLKEILAMLSSRPGVILEAVYSHFADIEDTTSHDYAELQKSRFLQQVEQVRAAGFPQVRRHIACTAATLLFQDIHFDMIRLGIGQYGLWPSRETLVSYRETHGKGGERLLQPVLAWKTRVTQLRWVPAGQTVGYGRTFKTTRRTCLAVLPVGYSDGYPRALSNQSCVLIGGRRAAVRGRICMNLMMVDVTDIPGVAVEDEVVLIGRQAAKEGEAGEEQVSVEELAGIAGSINYEIVSRLSRDIPRVVVG